MKIIKPLKLSMLNRPYKFRRKNWFAVSPICFFDLISGNIISEAEGWKKVMKAPGMENGFDIAMPKKSGEFLASGKACAPNGQMVATMDVSIRLGGIEKKLRVTGDREWRTDLLNNAVLSFPELYDEKNITWENAYGGSKHPENPAGKGYQKRYKLLTGIIDHIPWPNIEDPEKPLKNPGKQYTPESFGMIDISLKKRQKKAGTYNKKWLKHDHPGFPDDIDWSIFNAACEKQWNNGFFHGDESYEITGMHPEKPLIKGALPKVRSRVFINQEEGSDHHFREIETRLDTVWFLPDIETGILIFRGRTLINDSDALDIKSILLAYENMADSKRTADYYNDIHDKRADIKTAAAHVFNESQLSPEKSPEQKQREADEKIQAEQKAVEIKQKAIEKGIKAFQNSTGTALPESFKMPIAEPDPVGTIPPEAMKRNDFDLSEVLENVQKLTQMHMEEGKKKLKVMAQEMPEESIETVESKIKRLKKAAAQKALEKGGTKEKKDLLNLLKENNQLSKDLKQDLQNAGKQMMKARQISPEPLAPEEDYPAEVSISLRELVIEIINRGDSLCERDLAGADLSNIDFSGLDMSGIMLEKANLTGCGFRKASLTNGVLNSAVIDGADFSGSQMQGVNLCNARGENILFKGCDLSGAMFIKTSLINADFSSCVLKNINGISASFIESDFSDCQFDESLFIDAELDGTRFDKSIFHKCIFTNSKSECSSFSKTEITKCAFVNIEADGSDFSEAKLKTVQFAGDSLLRICNFKNIDARECGFRKGDFADSCFNGGGLIKSDLGDVSFARTSIKETVFSKSIMMGADIRNAEIEKADFYEALLRKADFSGTDLKQINFFSTELSEAVMPHRKQMKGIVK